MHMLWRLPQGDSDYSWRMGRLKATFTKAFRLAHGGQAGRGGVSPAVTAADQRKRYSGIWQPRFWEHTIRDGRDFKMHLDYIHSNPVRHGLVAWPKEWPWSSFRRYVRLGEYDEDWCGRVDLPGQVEYLNRHGE